jgi:SAM-dependent methyltransferase
MTKRTNPNRSVPHVSFDGNSGRRRERKRDEILAQKGVAPGPRPPAILMIYDDLNEDVGPAPIYGQYPSAFIRKILPWLRCQRHEILHVCSGSLPPGEGIRVDIRPEAKPDILADGRNLPLADGSVAAVMLDPPYTEHYARQLYGVDYPRPSHLLREAARVVRPGGRICFVHYITPEPPKGTRFVKAFGLSTGFDMPIRAVTLFERDQESLL